MALFIQIWINQKLIKVYHAVNITKKEGSGQYGKGLQTYRCQDGTILKNNFDILNGAVNLSKKLLNKTKPI